MAWHASLELDYRHKAGNTVVHHRHSGPLRLFNSLYPEGPGICHNVIIHPPGGLVEGDTLNIDVNVGPDAHALVSTPGATRFYRSEGEAATQQVRLKLAAGARLEWVPLETIAYPGCQGHNLLDVTLEPGAELLAWDVTALGLPQSGQAFGHGMLHQRMAIDGLWLEEGHIHAHDQRLLDSPLGLGGHRCLATLVLASGTAWSRERREALLDAVRARLPATLGDLPAGATCPNDQTLVVRAVAPLVEPVMALFQQLWAELRASAWGLSATPPRIWRV
jgi:urease accessory protein